MNDLRVARTEKTVRLFGSRPKIIAAHLACRGWRDVPLSCAWRPRKPRFVMRNEAFRIGPLNPL